MLERLSASERRTVKIGAACAVAILVFTFGKKWYDDWSDVRDSLTATREKLDAIGLDEAKQKALFAIVPVFEMPKAEEQQMFLFRDKFNEQLKRAGIKSEPLQVLPLGKKKGEYRLLRMKCTGKGRFGQVLDLLANLKENPYLVGIEEMKIQCDPKKPQDQRQEVELELTVSTFVK
ncbi:MAG: hypothetical protein JSU70_13220 [Phycisphaerales bacterium]|nr:MAG: hypothetical protein JSU70_13220 [Phycisphaerales bacterium]